jgi:hypothetical protein
VKSCIFTTSFNGYLQITPCIRNFLSGTEHLKPQYHVTFQDRTTKLHEYWTVHSILTQIPKTPVAHRYPYYYTTTRTDCSVYPTIEIDKNSTTPVIFHHHQNTHKFSPCLP